jgi:hypothetical protein
LVEQAVEAARDKAPTPFADRLRRDPLARRDCLVAQARAQPNTMRARNARACAVLRRCA